MGALTTIGASEAEATFSELLDRVQRGESFSITLRGEEVARIVPVKRPKDENIQEAIAQIKASRCILTPPGKKKLKIKDLIKEGRR
jgi:prevent-host-death family protein